VFVANFLNKARSRGCGIAIVDRIRDFVLLDWVRKDSIRHHAGFGTRFPMRSGDIIGTMWPGGLRMIASFWRLLSSGGSEQLRIGLHCQSYPQTIYAKTLIIRDLWRSPDPFRAPFALDSGRSTEQQSRRKPVSEVICYAGSNFFGTQGRGRD
jgi:hypothetical protein